MNTKKKTIIVILSIIILLSFASSIYAFEISEKGIKIGINLSKSTGEFISDPKSKLGFVGGFFLTSKITQKISLQTELLYSMKGYLLKDNAWDIEATFTYLQLPLLLKYNLISNEIVKFDLLVGPSLNYNLSAKYDSIIFDINYKDDMDLNKYDVGANFGFCAAKEILNSNSIFIDLRYELGLLNWDAIETSDENFNRTFSITIGVSL